MFMLAFPKTDHIVTASAITTGISLQRQREDQYVVLLCKKDDEMFMVQVDLQTQQATRVVGSEQLLRLAANASALAAASPRTATASTEGSALSSSSPSEMEVGSESRPCTTSSNLSRGQHRSQVDNSSACSGDWVYSGGAKHSSNPTASQRHESTQLVTGDATVAPSLVSFILRSGSAKAAAISTSIPLDTLSSRTGQRDSPLPCQRRTGSASSHTSSSILSSTLSLDAEQSRMLEELLVDGLSSLSPSVSSSLAASPAMSRTSRVHALGEHHAFSGLNVQKGDESEENAPKPAWVPRDGDYPRTPASARPATAIAIMRIRRIGADAADSFAPGTVETGNNHALYDSFFMVCPKSRPASASVVKSRPVASNDGTDGEILAKEGRTGPNMLDTMATASLDLGDCCKKLDDAVSLYADDVFDAEEKEDAVRVPHAESDGAFKNAPSPTGISPRPSKLVPQRKLLRMGAHSSASGKHGLITCPNGSMSGGLQALFDEEAASSHSLPQLLSGVRNFVRPAAGAQGVPTCQPERRATHSTGGMVRELSAISVFRSATPSLSQRARTPKPVVLPPSAPGIPNYQCSLCNKKLRMATCFTCRCQQAYCAQHRYSDRHACTYDYRAKGKSDLQRTNPLVQQEKVSRI
jgi:hypothetical protein